MLNITKKSFQVGLVAALVASASVAQSQEAGPTPLLTRSAAEWITVLKSDAPLKEKMDACRELSVIGGPESVKVLAGLLPDAKLSHMARYALEPMPYDNVNPALRDALKRTQGRELAGVIGSLGVRRDAKAVPSLEPLLGSKDLMVAQAAARALGSIGTSDAARALQTALRKAQGQLWLDVAEGLLRVAEIQAADGNQAVATAIYEKLEEWPDAPHQVHTAGLRGELLMKGDGGVAVLEKNLAAADYLTFSSACRASLEMPGDEVAGALGQALSRAEGDRAVLLLQTLARRGDAAAGRVLLKTARRGPVEKRVLAIRLIPRTATANSKSAARALVKLAGDSNDQVAGAARESLGAIDNVKVDQTIRSWLDMEDAVHQEQAIQLAVRRRTTGLEPRLRALASNSSQPSVRIASINALGELGGEADIQVLLQLVTRLQADAELNAAGRALQTLCPLYGTTDAHVSSIATQLDATTPAQRGVLLELLGSLGGRGALALVTKSARDKEASVRASAIRILTEWNGAEAERELLRLAREAGSPKDRLLCLRGYLGRASSKDVPPARRLKMCEEAAPLITRSAEKRILLSALSGIPLGGAALMIQPHLNNPEVRQEAASALLAVAEAVLKAKQDRINVPMLISPLESLVKVAGDEETTKRANTLLRKARAQSGR